MQSQIEEMVKAKGLSENIIFMGTRRDIPECLSAMDLFVFPSLFEGMPNTVIEAQAAGLPCLIADTITPEANVTGLVSYCSLNETAESWAVRTLQAAYYERKSQYSILAAAGYTIEESAKDFVQYVFQGKRNEASK